MKFTKLENQSIEVQTYFNYNSYDKKQKELNSNYVKTKKYFNPLVFEKEHGMIVKVSDIQYDYIVENVLISQRGKASLNILKEIINEKIQPLDYERKLKFNVA